MNTQNPQKPFIEYIKMAREYKKQSAHLKSDLNIAILSTSTIKGLSDVIMVKCAEKFSKNVSFFSVNYHQVHVVCKTPGSQLYTFDPDIIFLFLDIRNMLGEDFFSFSKYTTNERFEKISQLLAKVSSLVESIQKLCSAKIVVHNFEVPSHSEYGIARNSQKWNTTEVILQTNRELMQLYRDNSQVFIYDYEGFCSFYGKKNIFDPKMYYLGDIQVSQDFLPHLADEYLRFIRPMFQLQKKCLVLDLDNTLWGGIIGEDGIENIHLGPTPQGKPFWEFQKYILALFHRGIILAINSKNNLHDALEVIRNHPYMVLREEHFAALAINWENKDINMESLSQTINIGIDSMVFIDDNPKERALVRTSHPEVEVVEMPQDPSLYVSTLMQLNSFDSFLITKEDTLRGKQYAINQKRKAFTSKHVDTEDFLDSLHIQVCISPLSSQSLGRVVQLIEKTNQFNLTTQRYTHEQIQQFVDSKKKKIYTLSASDTFGDHGLVGVAIVEKELDVWTIDTFLLSCRVIGIGVEQALFAFISQEANKNGIHNIIGRYIQTPKNVPAQDFYKKCSFQFVKKCDEIEIWKYNNSTIFPFPSHITLLSSYNDR